MTTESIKGDNKTRLNEDKMGNSRSYSNETDFVKADKDKDAEGLIRAISAEFDVVMGSSERVKSSCLMLLNLLNSPPSQSDIECLKKLIPLFPKKMGAIVTPLFDLFCGIAESVNDPWPFLQALLSVRDKDLVIRALDLTASLSQSGILKADVQVLYFLADKIEDDDTPLSNPEAITAAAETVKCFSGDSLVPKSSEDAVTGIFLHHTDIRLRMLAARILDLSGEPVPEQTALSILGEDAFPFFKPYLLHTRASYSNLICLIPVPCEAAPSLSRMRSAELSCGVDMLKEVVSLMGWPGLNYGITCDRLVNIKAGSSFPLTVSDAEAFLFDSVNNVSRENELLFFTGHGGLPAGVREKKQDKDPVMLFRAYNLSHARILPEFTETEQLTPEKINRMLSEMDRIVDDYLILFSSYSTESVILPDVYGKLKKKILGKIEGVEVSDGASPELSRLVLMFEDPSDLGAVETLHGLKRYLHQKGLRLGFRLVDTSCAMNRTVSLAISSDKKNLNLVSSISYIDFEPDKEDADPADLPYPVKIAADAYSRQMLRGVKDFPNIKIFCYGSEVNYYISFRSHPAFLRINFSHPLNGGMIDLEYYGVSKTEIDKHPDLSLDAIKYFFSYLGFDVDIEQTHIRVRYDKNRTMDTEDLYEKAEMIFNLVPYFMDIDWTICSLDLSKSARDLVVKAWAGFFKKWGVLPMDQILTEDRRSIIAGLSSGYAGEQVIIWNGKEPYADHLSSSLPDDLIQCLNESLKKLGMDMHRFSFLSSGSEIGQLQIEKQVLSPFREACSLGGIVKEKDGLSQPSPDLFQYEWESSCFAGILGGSEDEIASSYRLARLVEPLETNTYFINSGSINGYRVQYATVPVSGRAAGVYILRDEEGHICFSFYTEGSILCRKRENTDSSWISNSSTDAVRLFNLLRKGNCLMPGMDIADAAPEKALSAAYKFRQTSRKRENIIFKGERIIKGVKVSPGRTVGRVLFDDGNRSPEDFKGKILVTPEIHPEDNALIYNSAGIVTTGGGILSHAALTAVQFKKPSLIIHGKWEITPSGRMNLLSYFFKFQDENKECSGYKITARSIITRNSYYVREGDFAVLDSDEGILSILGQGEDTVKFHESFTHFCENTESLMAVKDTQLILTLRGRRLRALYHLEKLLAGISDPFLACHIVYELLVSEHLSFNRGNRNEKVDLISIILKNPDTGKPAGEYLLDIFKNLNLRHHALFDEIKKQLSSYGNVYERLFIRLKLLKVRRALKEACKLLNDCGFKNAVLDESVNEDIDELFTAFFKNKVKSLSIDAEKYYLSGMFHLARHLSLQIERLDSLLKTRSANDEPVKEIMEKIISGDEISFNRVNKKLILNSRECGIEVSKLTGWKAANLSEVERLEGEGLVPPWFAVTDNALGMVLDLPCCLPAENKTGDPASCLKDVIKSIVKRTDIDDMQKSRKIARVWEELALPDDLVSRIIAAYRGLQDNSCSTPCYVSVRSSAGDEDQEASTNAGLFDTFLYVRGEKDVIKYLKKVWAGFWGERAIYQRSLAGAHQEMPGGGVIIQRLISSRVSGVLQTINAAEGRPKELVINAGLGLGQGIVSGRVPGDQIFVEKEKNSMENPGEQVKFRYFTREKIRQAVFNKWEGRGVVYSSTPHHRRLRPALKYGEICTLARLAWKLETAYGYPLDIEFCFENDRLWILQCRPVAGFMKILQETIKYYPLACE